MTDERIFAYLLGELPEEESERFEGQCFAAEDWPEQISLAEEDLVDAYLRGELSSEQHQHFERNYLITEERRKRVAVAAGLLRYVGTLRTRETAAPRLEPPGTNWFGHFLAFSGGRGWAMRAGLAVSVLAVIVGALWFARSHTNAPRTFATITLTISADSNRAEGVQAGRVKLQPGTDALRIHLKLPGLAAAAARYRIELVSREADASSMNTAEQDSESVMVEIPAARLTRGQYAVRLFAVMPDGTEQRVSGIYLFIVE
jgi:hypothetical protein